MPLFLVTAVCDEGVSPSRLRVVESESREAIARHMLEHPWHWEPLLRNSAVWWDLTRYAYKYDRPLGWSPADLLARLDATRVDGDSSDQVRVLPLPEAERLPP